MLSKTLQLCLTLYHPTNCSLPGSTVHGDSQGKNTGVGRGALLSTESSQLRDRNRIC